jgi:hypothetical protein
MVKLRDIAVTCNHDRAPRGWWCSRPRGHDGPCLPRPEWWNVRGRWEDAQTGTSRLNIDKAALWLCGFAVLALGMMLGFLLGVLALA